MNPRSKSCVYGVSVVEETGGGDKPTDADGGISPFNRGFGSLSVDSFVASLVYRRKKTLTEWRAQSIPSS